MIRVMEVKFFANNTFATVAGLGGNILRGKFDIIGQDRDQLWMQVWRFGFGRSVSGSVYRYVRRYVIPIVVSISTHCSQIQCPFVFLVIYLHAFTSTVRANP